MITRPPNNRTITAAGTWTSVDSRQHLTARDQALVTRLAEALMAADRLQLELPALLHLMRDHQAGQPRAASYSPSNGSGNDSRIPEQWEIDEPVTGHHDPTGDHATGHDPAANHQREMRRHIEAAITALDRAIGIGHQYPTQPEYSEDVEPSPGEDFCTACFADNKYLQPIAINANGTRKYAGLCTWCGQFKAANGFQPPTQLLHRRHRGERITEAMVTEARAEWKRRNPAKPKGKNRKVRVK